MDINPHYPIERYTVEGFPLSSLEAFRLYVMSEEFQTLTTDDKTIIGAINELKYAIDNFDLDGYATTAWVTEYVTGLLDGYVTTVTFAALESRVDTLETTVAGHTTALADLDSRVTVLEGRCPEPITFVLSSNTNPRYFTASNPAVVTTSHHFHFTHQGEFVQSTDYNDGILEIMNFTFADNVHLVTNDGTPVDSNTNEEYYIPMLLEYFDSNNAFVNSKTVMLTGIWSREAGGYDFSVYFRDTVTIPTGGKVVYKFSGVIPYNSVPANN